MDEIDTINPFAELGSPPAANHTLGDGDEQLQPPPVPVKPPSNAGSAPPTPAPVPRSPLEGRRDFCCAKDQWLREEGGEIHIVDAQKTSEGSNASYITYLIRSGSSETRRRYSDFASLQICLVKLYPCLIVPPIPSKTSIGDYAVKQGKAKEDVSMIARRKRLLQDFLRRIGRHPILGGEHVVHRFLSGDVSWTEILSSPPLSILPKSTLRCPPNDPVSVTKSPELQQLYNILPQPSHTQSLIHPDQRFLDSEIFTEKFGNHMQGVMEKVWRRAGKRLSEFAQDHAELGAALNGFSLNEEEELAGTIEKLGQAIDSTYLNTSVLLQHLEQTYTEPLSTYVHFGQIIQKLLAFRHMKHLQVEGCQREIESKRIQLDDMERVEREAGRLNAALQSGRVDGRGSGARNGPQVQPGANLDGTVPTAQTISYNDDTSENQNQPSVGDTSSPPPSSPSLLSPSEDDDLPPSYTPAAPPPPVKRRTPAPGMGLLNALSYTLHGMMDVDPETSRRNNMTRLGESITQLEEALRISTTDLKFASSTIQADLDRFQRQKVADLRDMMLEMAKGHVVWAKKNQEMWQEVKSEVGKIEVHPNDKLAGVTGDEPRDRGSSSKMIVVETPTRPEMGGATGPKSPTSVRERTVERIGPE